MKKTVTLVILVFVIALAAVGYLFKDELMSLNPFFKNDLYFSFKENNKDRWGIMNFKGEIIVDSEWDEEPSISNDGIARVKDKKGNFQFFTIEKNPKQIGDDYKFAGDFSDGLAAVVKEGEGIEFINLKGRVELSLRDVEGKVIDAVRNLQEGLICFKTTENKWGFLDAKGMIKIEPIYDEAYNFSNGLALVGKKTTDDKIIFGLIDSDNQIKIPFKDGIKFSSSDKHRNNLIAFTDESGEWGFMNVSAEKVIKQNAKFKRVLGFNEGYASFFDGEKWGIINSEGEIEIRPKYDFAYFQNGIAMVVDDKDGKYLSITGEEAINDEFDEVLPFINNRTIVKNGSRYNLIDKTGKSIGRTDFEVIGSSLVDKIIIDDATTILSDYFDAPSVVKIMISSISETLWNKVGTSHTFGDVIDILKLDTNELQFESTNSIKIEPVQTTAYELQFYYVFAQDVKEELFIPNYSTDYFGNPVITNIPAGSKINLKAPMLAQACMVQLFGKGKDRSSSLIKSIISKIEAEGLKTTGFDKNSETNPSQGKITFNNSNDVEIIELEYNPSQITMVHKYTGTTVSAPISSIADSTAL